MALFATIVAAFVAYLVLASAIGSPRAFSDELLYFDTAASLVEGDGLAIRGEPYRYSALYPAVLAALIWVAPNRESAYELAKALNAFLFVLAAIPIFLLGRRILPPWPSVTAAAFSILIPSATYVSVVMTESVAYLVFWWALYAIVLALERPTAARQLAVLLIVLLAVSVRLQFLVLYAVYLLGLVLLVLVVPEQRSRLKAAPRSLWPTALSLALGMAGVVFPFAFGSDSSLGALGPYSVLWRSYDLGEVAKWLVYHLANLELNLAIVPFAVAPIVLATLFARGRRGREREAAFVVLFVVANALLLLQTATFNSTEFAQGLFQERPLFYVVPLWIVVLFVWLVEGAPKPLFAAGSGVAVALVLPFFLPYGDYVRDHPFKEPTVLWAAVDEASDSLGLASGRGLLIAFTILLAIATLLPIRFARLLPVLVVIVFAITAELSWFSAARWAGSRALAMPRAERAWLDERVPSDQSVTFLTTLSPCARFARDAFYLSEFFNSSVAQTAHLGELPDALPRLEIIVAGDGQLLLGPGNPLMGEFVVVQPGIRLDGRRVREGTNARLVLWEVGGPVRALGAGSSSELKRQACRAAPR